MTQTRSDHWFELFARTWQLLLPIGSVIACGPGVENTPQLSAAEHESAGLQNEERAFEYRNGRMYAKRALSRLGVAPGDLTTDTTGSPCWPKSCVGSLTHSRTSSRDRCFAAAVARSDVLSALGIDMERLEPLAPAMWESILHDDEGAALNRLAAGLRGAQVLRIWSCKEAVAKAANRPFDPRLASIRFVGQHTFTATHPSDDAPAANYLGATRDLEGMVLSVALRFSAPKLPRFTATEAEPRTERLIEEYSWPDQQCFDNSGWHIR